MVNGVCQPLTGDVPACDPPKVLINGECQLVDQEASCNPVTEVEDPITGKCQLKGTISCPAGQVLASDGICYPEGEEPITPPPVAMMSFASFASFSFAPMFEDFSFIAIGGGEENNEECIFPEILNDEGLCYLPEEEIEGEGECILPEILNDEGLCYLPEEELEGEGECIFPEVLNDEGLCYLPEEKLDQGLQSIGHVEIQKMRLGRLDSLENESNQGLQSIGHAEMQGLRTEHMNDQEDDFEDDLEDDFEDDLEDDLEEDLEDDFEEDLEISSRGSIIQSRISGSV
jgi:hypothetical protein